MKKLLVILSAVILAACGGGGGSNATAPATPASTPASTPVAATPIPVQKSSYLNKVTAAAAIGPQSLPAEVASGNAVAFADFFQDGSYSMVTHACGDTTCGGNGNAGAIHFYKKVNGAWVDHTSDILANTAGCVHPRKAVVADFNGDGKPDVFFACHGVDAPPYPGEQPHILLSQPNGSYQNVTLPFTGYFHGASAADFSGNGHADIVVTDNIVHHFPYFLVNNGDGTFHQDFTRLPPVQMYGKNGEQPVLTTAAVGGAQIYTAELVDFNNTGKFDLFLGGTAPDDKDGNWVPTIFKNNGDNTYAQTNVTELPYNKQYETTLDILSVNGAIYTTNVHLTYATTGSPYGNSDIEKDVGGNSSQIYAGNTTFQNGDTWINWIVPYQGKIDSLNADYGVSVAQ